MPGTETERLLLRVGQVLRKKDFDRALDLLQEVFFLEPDNAEARICLAFLKGAGTRRARRYHVDLTGTIDPGGPAESSAILRDVSSLGIRLESKKPVQNGTTLAIHVPRERYGLPPLSIAGKVCWVRKEGEAFAAGITLEAAPPESVRNLEILALKTYFFPPETAPV